ncbi:MAG: hypothetical protein ACERKN_22165 [Velocimicrobium sp.]
MFYNQFLERQSGKDKKRNAKFLFFDEYASYLNYLPKKEAEEEKRKMSMLLMMGRSFNSHVIISQQRGDAQYFSTARDNLNVVIGLSNLSEESRDMFFSSFKKQIKADRKRGTGYMITNGTDLQKIYVPKVQNEDMLHNAIKQGVSR